MRAVSCVALVLSLVTVATAVTLRIDSPPSHAGTKLFAANSLFTDTASLANGGSQAQVVFFGDDPEFCKERPPAELQGRRVAVVARRGGCFLEAKCKALIGSKAAPGSFVLLHDHSSLQDAAMCDALSLKDIMYYAKAPPPQRDSPCCCRGLGAPDMNAALRSRKRFPLLRIAPDEGDMLIRVCRTIPIAMSFMHSDFFQIVWL